MSLSKLFQLLSLSALLSAGCEPPPAPEPLEQTMQPDWLYGSRPNDPSRYPPMVAGERLWGLHKRSGVSLPAGEYAYETWGSAYHNASISYYGLPVVEVTANNTLVSGKYKSGTAYYTYSGSSMNGTIITFTANNGIAYNLKFDVQSSQTNDHSVAYNLYSLRYKQANQPDTSYVSACRNPDTLADEPAMVLNRWGGDGMVSGGAFTQDWLTFSCLSDTLTQCVSWGYAWWDWVSKTTTTCTYVYDYIDGVRVRVKECTDDTVSVNLLDYFDACRNVKRADYCGDNYPQTVRGKQIQLYEKGLPVPIHSAYPTDMTVLEGGWSKNRTLCINDPHRSSADPNWYPSWGCRWEFWVPGQYPMPTCSDYTGSSSEPILLGSRYVQ